jgi:hypothetical protein
MLSMDSDKQDITTYYRTILLWVSREVERIKRYITRMMYSELSFTVGNLIWDAFMWRY